MKILLSLLWKVVSPADSSHSYVDGQGAGALSGHPQKATSWSCYSQQRKLSHYWILLSWAAKWSVLVESYLPGVLFGMGWTAAQQLLRLWGAHRFIWLHLHSFSNLSCSTVLWWSRLMSLYLSHKRAFWLSSSKEMNPRHQDCLMAHCCAGVSVERICDVTLKMPLSLSPNLITFQWMSADQKWECLSKTIFLRIMHFINLFFVGIYTFLTVYKGFRWKLHFFARRVW